MRKDPSLLNIEANERRMLSRIRVADLVTVTSFNEQTKTVNVKPLVKREIDGMYVSPPPILGVKVASIPAKVTIEGITAAVEPEIKAGDIGIIVYLDLDSDNSLKTGAESQPNSGRIHSGDDAVFVGVIIPG